VGETPKPLETIREDAEELKDYSFDEKIQDIYN
jgi:hypothetical protein